MSDNAVYNGQLVHYTGDKILFLDGSAVTDGSFVTNSQKTVLLQAEVKEVGYRKLLQVLIP